jgi:acyl-CoA thioesterase YciA
VKDQDFYEDADPWRGRLALRGVATPAETSFYGGIFGGWLMSHADIAGARNNEVRHVRGNKDRSHRR